MSVWAWLAIGPLGALAALARVAVGALVDLRAAHSFPLGTLVVNTSGSLLIGLLSGVAVSGDALVLLGAAAVGSYSTFSTWMFETRRLVENGGRRAALLNVLGSLVLGLGAAALGRVVGGAF